MRYTSLHTGILLAVVAGVALAPTVARAGCGDYLTRAPQALGPDHQGLATGVMPDPRAAGPMHGPCHGPNCSRNRVPPPPPAPTVSVSVHDCAWFIVSAALPASDGMAHASGSFPCHPTAHIGKVERPPRS